MFRMVLAQNDKSFNDQNAKTKFYRMAFHCVTVIEDHMLDWHLCQICYPLEIKLLSLLSLPGGLIFK